jgi:hypothetical protein
VVFLGLTVRLVSELPSESLQETVPPVQPVFESVLFAPSFIAILVAVAVIKQAGNTVIVTLLLHEFVAENVQVAL